MNLLQFALHEMLLAQVLILIFVNVHLCCDPFSYRRNLQLKFLRRYLRRCFSFLIMFYNSKSIQSLTKLMKNSES